MTIAAIGSVVGVAPTPPTVTTNTTTAAGSSNFASMLESASQMGVNADQLASQVATGELPNIQTFTSAAAKAELAVSLAVQVRNRAVEAYQEIMRMSI